MAHITAHSCSFPGCGTVLVLDGNMKNRRDVCFAKDAGFIEFEGLPGLIKTGCTASPAYKSQYCDLHKNHACELAHDEEMIEVAGTSDTIHKQRQRTCKTAVAETILAKKATRSQTYYQASTCTLPISQHAKQNVVKFWEMPPVPFKNDSGFVAGSPTLLRYLGTSVIPATAFDRRVHNRSGGRTTSGQCGNIWAHFQHSHSGAEEF